MCAALQGCNQRVGYDRPLKTLCRATERPSTTAIRGHGRFILIHSNSFFPINWFLLWEFINVHQLETPQPEATIKSQSSQPSAIIYHSHPFSTPVSWTIISPVYAHVTYERKPIPTTWFVFPLAPRAPGAPWDNPLLTRPPCAGWHHSPRLAAMAGWIQARRLQLQLRVKQNSC